MKFAKLEIVRTNRKYSVYEGPLQPPESPKSEKLIAVFREERLAKFFVKAYEVLYPHPSQEEDCLVLNDAQSRELKERFPECFNG